MKKLPFILLSILVFGGSLPAQTECPKIDITGPSGITEPGRPITFTASVEPTDKDLKYTWSISSGKMIEGQGTLAIKVLPENGKEFSITATVEITGLPTECSNNDSATASQVLCPTSEKLDEFRGPITVKHKIHIANAEVRLHNTATDRLVIVLYYESARKREIDKRAILRYFHPFVKARITFVDGPDRGDGPSIRIWLVPAGAADPEP